MKKSLVTVLSIGLLSFSALAENESAGMSVPQAQFYSAAGEVITGETLGGIEGAVSAESLAPQYRRRRWVTCYAEDNWGRIFAASSYNAWAAQDRAMRRCFSYSYYCRRLGCRW